jgi:hypothetical protein
LARVNFELSPIAIDRTNALLTPTCILVTPDDEHLLIVKHHSFGLWLAEPESLANAGGIFWVAMGRVGAISPDGTIAYLLYDSASTSQRLVALPLE